MAMSTPKMGPEPTLLSRKEVDALYETFQAVIGALETLEVSYIVTGGSLLGAVRQHSILFCDDDIDIAIIETDDGAVYERVASQLQSLLGKDFQYQIGPWEGGDRVRPKRMNTVFLDLFVLRRYESLDELKSVIGLKKNGLPQSEEYIQGIVKTIESCAFSQNETQSLFPFWHFKTRKAVEMWPKEVYRQSELFPLHRSFRFGPIASVSGPRMPVLLLKRAFGQDCFHVYYQSATHKGQALSGEHHQTNMIHTNGNLPPLTFAAGTWESGRKLDLEDQHYLPMQPISRAARRPTMHGRNRLFEYLRNQIERETKWQNERVEPACVEGLPPRRTVYMDGVFDLFHIGHLEAIRQCAQLGDRVIIGVTGDKDATGYKRAPIICERERATIVESLGVVDEVVCPCPLVVTDEFMSEKGIDLVVHGFPSEEDAKRQEEFFSVPMKRGKFQTISYYNGLSTTDIMQKILGTFESQSVVRSTTVVSHGKPRWFGSTVAAATSNAPHIPYDPFPLTLRETMEPHIQKARARRGEVLGAIKKASGKHVFDETLTRFNRAFAKPGNFQYDVSCHPLLPSLLESGGLSAAVDLRRLHEVPGTKEKLLYTLTKQPSHFQEIFDKFVLQECAPKMASCFDCDEIFYQCFPCVRIVQPGEFSIGPHCDAAYGHHPCSVNFYALITQVDQTSAAVFIESRQGAEDWHPITGNYGKILLPVQNKKRR